MKLHEYQAKEILKKHGVGTPKSQVCFTVSEVKEAALRLGFPCVIKAQVHAGGRGKAGGVKLAKNVSEAEKFAQSLLGTILKTEQTDFMGQKVNCVLVEEGCDIARELYLGMVIDREKSALSILASTEGGMDIEEVAHRSPQSIVRQWIHPVMGLMPFQIRQIAHSLRLGPEQRDKFGQMLSGIYETFLDADASMIEINPLVVTKKGDLLALDAKLTIDDNALFRQKLIAEMRDPSQEDPKEVEAQKNGLSYVALEGNIGCMVNGAGLAMATMDIIKYEGGMPANFLDVGGSATKERVEEALRIIAQDHHVKAIFVNVFGGIARCDVIASGIVDAARLLSLSLPLVVRLEGTKVEEGKAILQSSGLEIIAANDMLDGAKKAVKAAL